MGENCEVNATTISVLGFLMFLPRPDEQDLQKKYDFLLGLGEDPSSSEDAAR